MWRTVGAAARLGRLTGHGERLAAALWPGPLTLVLRRQTDCPIADLATAGLATVAVRVPAHPIAQALLTKAAGAGRGAERQPIGTRQPDHRRRTSRRISATGWR